MRTYCLDAKASEVYGIMTNFKEWIFTKYSFLDEARSMITNESQGNPFQISKVFKIIKKVEEQTHETIDKTELHRVITIV